METITDFEQFLKLIKDEHERQNKEANDLEKRLSTIEKDLEKLKDIIEKTTTRRVTKAVQELEKSKREFPKTFKEVLDILKTGTKDDHVDFLYILWIGITNNQDVISQRATLQELAVLKCMLITKAINTIDNSCDSRVHFLYFYLDGSGVSNYDVDYSGSLFMPDTLTFKSKIGANHALKYFKEEWMRMFASSK